MENIAINNVCTCGCRITSRAKKITILRNFSLVRGLFVQKKIFKSVVYEAIAIFSYFSPLWALLRACLGPRLDRAASLLWGDRLEQVEDRLGLGGWGVRPKWDQGLQGSLEKSLTGFQWAKIQVSSKSEPQIEQKVRRSYTCKQSKNQTKKLIPQVHYVFLNYK